LILRNLLLGGAMFAIAACGKTTPTSPSANGSCVDLSGTYDVTYQGQCPTQYPKQWTLQQTMCDAHTAIAPDAPIVTGTVKGNAVHLQMQNGFTACLYTLEGDGQFDGQAIRAQLSGKTSGPCCGDQQEALTVVAVRRSGP
jgi:hypothetical protein